MFQQIESLEGIPSGFFRISFNGVDLYHGPNRTLLSDYHLQADMDIQAIFRGRGGCDEAFQCRGNLCAGCLGPNCPINARNGANSDNENNDEDSETDYFGLRCQNQNSSSRKKRRASRHESTTLPSLPQSPLLQRGNLFPDVFKSL